MGKVQGLMMLSAADGSDPASIDRTAKESNLDEAFFAGDVEKAVAYPVETDDEMADLDGAFGSGSEEDVKDATTQTPQGFEEDEDKGGKKKKKKGLLQRTKI